MCLQYGFAWVIGVEGVSEGFQLLIGVLDQGCSKSKSTSNRSRSGSVAPGVDIVLDFCPGVFEDSPNLYLYDVRREGFRKYPVAYSVLPCRSITKGRYFRNELN
ncbi:hypothetical protein ASF51_12105 [Agreia sp. Leaf283]|nr:hypothetical protein ASF51_12105 [Agreia sp. Leaf283]